LTRSNGDDLLPSLHGHYPASSLIRSSPPLTGAVINNGDFITFLEANAGLKFTPNANFFGAGSFDLQASLGNTDAGLGGSVVTATVTVNAVANTPLVTNATTNEDTQTHFKITNILNGTLFLNNGTQYARAKPWVLKSADQFRPGPPPALSSAEWARDYNEVKSLGGTKSAARTPEQTEAVRR
jgi:hypothetical protein